MDLDIVLPSVITIVTFATFLLFNKVKHRLRTPFQQAEVGIREAAILVLVMGLMVTVFVFIPQQAIQLLFLFACSLILFLFGYAVLGNAFAGLIAPLIFVALYLFSWNLLLLNAFAILFAVLISVYVSSFFSWKTVIAFTALITAMDVIQVFLTGHMGESAQRAIELDLPLLIDVPTFPWLGRFRLGVGDIFLAGLLVIKTTEKLGAKAHILTSASLGLAFFLFEIVVLNTNFMGYFPATAVVVAGWLLGLGLLRLFQVREHI
jgi:presenilin-like A22 family membrane protease